MPRPERRSLLAGDAMIGRDGHRFRRWSVAAWWAADPEVTATLLLSWPAQGGATFGLLCTLPRLRLGPCPAPMRAVAAGERPDRVSGRS